MKRVKQLVATIMTCIMICTCVTIPGYSSKAEEEHDWGEWQITEEADGTFTAIRVCENDDSHIEVKNGLKRLYEYEDEAIELTVGDNVIGDKIEALQLGYLSGENICDYTYPIEGILYKVNVPANSQGFLDVKTNGYNSAYIYSNLRAYKSYDDYEYLNDDTKRYFFLNGGDETKTYFVIIDSDGWNVESVKYSVEELEGKNYAEALQDNRQLTLGNNTIKLEDEKIECIEYYEYIVYYKDEEIPCSFWMNKEFSANSFVVPANSIYNINLKDCSMIYDESYRGSIGVIIEFDSYGQRGGICDLYVENGQLCSDGIIINNSNIDKTYCIEYNQGLLSDEDTLSFDIEDITEFIKYNEATNLTCTGGYDDYYYCEKYGKYYNYRGMETTLEDLTRVDDRLHDWGEWEITEEADGTLTATRVCKNDASHVEVKNGLKRLYEYEDEAIELTVGENIIGDEIEALELSYSSEKESFDYMEPVKGILYKAEIPANSQGVIEIKGDCSVNARAYSNLSAVNYYIPHDYIDENTMKYYIANGGKEIKDFYIICFSDDVTINSVKYSVEELTIKDYWDTLEETKALNIGNNEITIKNEIINYVAHIEELQTYNEEELRGDHWDYDSISANKLIVPAKTAYSVMPKNCSNEPDNLLIGNVIERDGEYYQNCLCDFGIVNGVYYSGTSYMDEDDIMQVLPRHIVNDTNEEKTYYVIYGGMLSDDDTVTLEIEDVTDKVHDFHEHTYIDAVVPTCSTSGHQAYYYCEDSDKYFDLNGNETTLDDLTIAADNSIHDWGNWISDGDDTHSRSCSRCDETETENHTWDDGAVKREATYIRDGLTVYTCTACGETKDEILPCTGSDWTKACTNGIYAVEVGSDKKIKLNDLTQYGFDVDKLATESIENGIYNLDEKTITVEDIDKVVTYQYKESDDGTSTLSFAAYNSGNAQDDPAIIVIEETKENENDAIGGTVTTSIVISSDGEVTGKLNETVIESTSDENATITITENKDEYGEEVMDVKVEVEQETISNDTLIQSIDVADKKNDEYQSDENNAENENAKITTVEASFTDDTDDTEISSEVIEKLGEKDISLEVSKKDNDGNVEYTWNFLAEIIKAIIDALTEPIPSVNTKVDVYKEEAYPQRDELSEVLEDKPVTDVVSFSHEGKLPGETEVKVKFKNEYEDGKRLHYYHFDKQNNRLVYAGMTGEARNGYISFTIDHCSDYVFSEELLYVGNDHDHNLVKTDAVAATCTTSGNIAYWHCTVCDKYFSDADATTDISLDATGISAKGHNWGEWKVTTPATEEKEGVETRVCKNDNSHTETRSVPKLEKKQDASDDKQEEVKKPEESAPEVTPEKSDDTTPEVTPEKPDEISPEVTQEKPDEPKPDTDSAKDDESKQDSSQSASPAIEPVGSEFASYQGVDFYKDDSGDVRCYTNGVPVINDFKCDGEFTYFFQADGTAMKDRLTYHPDGEHVIYFDSEGHEVFSDFANVKKTIAGDEVDDYCFFDVFGYMYVDVVTYDKTGTVLYYANAYGVMEMGKWFQFSDKVTWADGRDGDEFKNQYGCANADGTLITNTQTIDWEGRSCYLQGNGVALY